MDFPSGEIVVATAMGQVVLNKPYQSTVTTVWEQVPTKTVILDLTVDLIDNLLIISPPKENEELQQTEGQRKIATLVAIFLISTFSLTTP